MVKCTLCKVNAVDRHCTNTPPTCFECCTTAATIHTCPPHFHSLGRPAAAARLATGMVHPNLIGDLEDVEHKHDDRNADDTSSSSSSSGPAGGPPTPPPQSDAAADAAAATGSAEQPSGPTLASLAASITSLSTLLQQLMQAQATATTTAAAASSPPPPLLLRRPVQPATPASLLPLSSASTTLAAWARSRRFRQVQPRSVSSFLLPFLFPLAAQLPVHLVWWLLCLRWSVLPDPSHGQSGYQG